MSSNADAIIAALRTGHDDLVKVVSPLTPEQLTGPSRATEWDVAEVLSHIGSASVIGLATLQHTLDPSLPEAVNQDVWDRWNSLSPVERKAEFPIVSEAQVAAYESLDDAARNDLRFEMGFLPAPVDLAFVAWMRLNELTLHAWDVRAQLDPTATLPDDAVEEMVDRSGTFLGFSGKAAEINGDLQILVETTGVERSFGLAITDSVAKVDAPAAPDATLRLPAEAFLRLTAGRLKPDVTPTFVSVTGPLTLDDLRRVFPGY
jgi:uncharacterized protein (TIGR03083 family)